MSDQDNKKKPALAELARALRHFDVQADTRQVALVLLELAKMESGKNGQLTDWLKQLARDMASDNAE